ncbi:divalent heavy-metal cations transporter [Escherichia coli DEC14D]|nr:divalent heavy-metal cations transporter [Escherichia coli DEC14D]
MNYSHDNWSAILAHIGKPEELDTSARNVRGSNPPPRNS